MQDERFKHRVSAGNAKIGLFLLVFPFLFCPLLALFALSINPSENVGFALLLLGLGAFAIGIPGGIYFLSQQRVSHEPYDLRSWQKNSLLIPEEVKGWNWGAAGLTFIWGISFNVWSSLLVFVPPLGLVMWLILGFKGNEWAWQNNAWESVEAFQRSQAKWRPWGIGVIVFILFWCAVSFLSYLFGE